MVWAPEVRTLSVTLCSLGPREEAPSMLMHLQREDKAELSLRVGWNRARADLTLTQPFLPGDSGMVAAGTAEAGLAGRGGRECPFV